MLDHFPPQPGRDGTTAADTQQGPAGAAAGPPLRVISPATYGMRERVRFVIRDLRTAALVLKAEIEAGGTYVVQAEDLEPHTDYAFKLQVLKDRRWTDCRPYEKLVPPPQQPPSASLAPEQPGTPPGSSLPPLRIVTPSELGIDEPARLVIRDLRADAFAMKVEIAPGASYAVQRESLPPHTDYTFKLQVRLNERWTDRTAYARLVPRQRPASSLAAGLTTNALPPLRLVTPADHGILETARLLVYDVRADRFALKAKIAPGATYAVQPETLPPHSDFIFKLQVQRDKNWIDQVPYDNLLPEQVTPEGIRYLLLPEAGARSLVIIFQTDSNNPRYNYMKSLAGLKAHRLYIKHDYGAVQTDNQLEIDFTALLAAIDATQALLKRMAAGLGVGRSQCTVVGTSKGGSAALFHGYRFGAGHLVVGGPQVMYGNAVQRLLRGRMDPAELDALVEWLNGALFKEIEARRDTPPRLLLHVGRGEPHYREHAVPLQQFMEAQGIRGLELDLGEYGTHAELATHFPPFLRRRLDQILREQAAPEPQG